MANLGNRVFKKKWTPERVIQLRLLAGLTQVEFAKCLGVSERAVRRWENGVYFPAGLSLSSLNHFAASIELNFEDPPDAK
jgi:DNA-binding transcriptional regulator YiaG